MGLPERSMPSIRVEICQTYRDVGQIICRSKKVKAT